MLSNIGVKNSYIVIIKKKYGHIPQFSINSQKRPNKTAIFYLLKEEKEKDDA